MSDADQLDDERLIWEGRTAWMDHAVLFLFLAAGIVRAAVALQQSQWMTAGLYGLTILCFLGIAGGFHFSRLYRLTSGRIQVRSWWSDRIVQEMSLKDVSDVTVRYELLNRWFDLGRLDIASRTTEDYCTIRGIPHPGDVKAQLERWIRVHRPPWEPVPTRTAPDHAP